MTDVDKEPSETHNSDTQAVDEAGGPIQEVPATKGGSNKISSSSSKSSPNASLSSSNNKKGLILGVVALVIVIVLAVSLGVALPKKNDDDDDKRSKAFDPWTAIESAKIMQPEHQVFQDFAVNEAFLVVVDVGAPDYSGILEEGFQINLDVAPPYKTHVRLYVLSPPDQGDTDSFWTLSDTLELSDAHPLSGPSVYMAPQAPVVVLADAQGGTTESVTHGAVRFYNVADGKFVLTAEMSDDDDDDWGSLVDLNNDGTRAAVARTLAQHPEGAVQVHEIVDGTTVQPLGSPLLAGAHKQDSLVTFGASLGGLALSGDGNLLAVGVPFHSEFEPSAGQVKLFAYDDSSNSSNNKSDWQELLFLDGQGGQALGQTVKLSTDGKVMAVSTRLSQEVFVYAYRGDTFLGNNENEDLWELVAELQGTDVHMNTGGTRIATVTEDDMVQVYDRTDGNDAAWEATGAPFQAAAVRVLDNGRIVSYQAGAVETLELI